MLRRRSTVRFHNGALVGDLIRKDSNGSWAPVGTNGCTLEALAARQRQSRHAMPAVPGLPEQSRKIPAMAVKAQMAAAQAACLLPAAQEGEPGDRQMPGRVSHPARTVPDKTSSSACRSGRRSVRRNWRLVPSAKECSIPSASAGAAVSPAWATRRGDQRRKDADSSRAFSPGGRGDVRAGGARLHQALSGKVMVCCM